MISPGIAAGMQDPNGFFFYDRMNDVNGTQMINHAMVKDNNGGAGWTMGAYIGVTQASSSATIQNNVLKFTVNDSLILMGSTSGSADPTIELEWTPKGTTDRNSIVTRYLDSNNMTIVNFRKPEGDIQQVNIVAGSPTVMTNTPFTWIISQTYKIKVTHAINFLTMYIDNVNKGGNVIVPSPSVVGIMRNTGDNLSEINNFTVSN
jgi:hypothetical protein